MRILIEKEKRRLQLLEGEHVLFACKIALGKSPKGKKQASGDNKTPEGKYHVCLKKQGKYGYSLGVSYPNSEDAKGTQDARLQSLILAAEQNKTRPPWGSPLGGEIFIHGGGNESDWTAGCIALRDEDAKTLYDMCPMGTDILILP